MNLQHGTWKFMKLSTAWWFLGKNNTNNQIIGISTTPNHLHKDINNLNKCVSVHGTNRDANKLIPLLLCSWLVELAPVFRQLLKSHMYSGSYHVNSLLTSGCPADFMASAPVLCFILFFTRSSYYVLCKCDLSM